MQDTTFNELSDLALTRSGQSIAPSKSYLIDARLSVILRREGFPSCDELVACLKARPNAVLEAEIVAAMQSHQTWFFRDRGALERVVRDIVPQKLKASKAGRVRIWCAGAATGQEAYSLAILLQEHEHALRGAKIELLATDLCRQSIAAAKLGSYGHFDIQRGLSVHRMMDHFDLLETGNWQASEDLRNMITFRTHNLLDDDTTLAPADIVLCRNVLSGMNKSTRGTVAERVANLVAPGGYLLLGETETLSTTTTAFEPSRRHRGAWDVVPAARRNVA